MRHCLPAGILALLGVCLLGLSGGPLNWPPSADAVAGGMGRRR